MPSRPLILLVEDEPTLSTLVGNLLNEAGYEHVSISDHKHITDAIDRWQPRCVILDSDPGSKGHELSWADAAAIRRAHPDLPVLMFTADPASMAEARAGKTARSRTAGYAGVIDKPFLVVEFLATLKHVVDGPSVARPSDGKGTSAEAIRVFPDIGGPAAADWSIADQFSTVVHELRTPLTAIAGQVQFAQKLIAKDPKRAGEALTRAHEQTKRMDHILGELLDHARAGANARSLDIVTFDLRVATAITIGLHEHDEIPRISFVAPAAVRVRGDPDRVAQVLGNLLDNAIKYSPPAAAIEVSLSVVGHEAVLRVSDRGVGVPDDERGMLFAPFFRTTRTRDISGTGLGLHISRRIAEQHHGRLWLESSGDGDGSVFALALPLAQD
jgi:signal transduction histidine kinase